MNAPAASTDSVTPVVASPATPGAVPAVELKDVYFSYGNDWVLEKVNLRVEARDFHCVLGPNGGGKTTLFKLILGLLHPARGQVHVVGQSPEEARRAIGYVPQHVWFDPLFPIQVQEVVRMGCLEPGYWWWTRRKESQARVDAALETVNLSDLRHRTFSSLSGGQRQRALIARALAAQPEILLLDEPTANIDPVAEQDILTLLQELRGKLTVLMVTHEIAVVSRFVENLICVHRHVHEHHGVTAVDEDLMMHMCGYDPKTKTAHRHSAECLK